MSAPGLGDTARFMRMAIALGARGLGRVWPNPAVGCVIVRGGVVVGRGWTQPGGRPHAEVVALAQAGAAARGADVYVSLEPCAHYGKTGPCAQALIDAGVARVVTALTDPDPRVAGRGHAMLRAAGIAVVTDVLADEARHGQRGFLSRVERGRPMVTLKLAMTLDGRIANPAGASRWITGGQARRAVHALRARHDAVLVGAGTARADDPDLRVRDMGIAAQPVRMVADARLTLPVDSRLGRSVEQGPVWMLHGPDAPDAQRQAWDAAGARLIACDVDAQGRLVPGDLLQGLGAAGITRVFCEGGGQWAAALLAQDLVDELMVFHAGRVFGQAGLPGVGALPARPLAAPDWVLHEVMPCGADVLHHWRRSR